GLLAQRDDALLRALAVPDMDTLLLEVDVAEVEPDRLGAAQPGRVDELDERPVAQRERLAAASEPVQQAVDLVELGRVRQAARPARGERGVRDAVRAEREPQQAAHGREPPRDRRRRELPT